MFHENLAEGISYPIFYGDLVNILRRVKCEPNFISSRVVKRLRRREYDPVIIKSTIGLELISSTALYRSFPNDWISYNAPRKINIGLSQPLK